jgi:hypothetical protein
MNAEEFFEELWKIPYPSNWYHKIKVLAASDDAHQLYDIAKAVDSLPVPSNAHPYNLDDLRRLSEDIINVLEWNPGKIQIETLMQILLIDRKQTADITPDWVLMSLTIVEEHDLAMVEAAATTYGQNKRLMPLFFEIAVELVSRGISIDGNPALLAAYDACLESKGLASKRLPPALFGIEKGLLAEYPLPLEDFLLIDAFNCDRVEPQSGGAVLEVMEVMEIPDREGMLSALAYWLANANGKADVRLYKSEKVIDPQQLGPDTLRALGIESASTNPVIRSLDAHFAYSLVFEKSVHGPYSKVVSSAQCRFLAWETLSAVAGVDRNAPYEIRNRVISDTVWFTFIDAGGWFYLDSWDVGLVALRPDRKTLVVLAATDTEWK